MPKSSTDRERRSLAAMKMRSDQVPAVIATKTLIRAGFLVVNSTNRPYQKLGLNLSQVDVLGALARSEVGLNPSEIAETTLITKGGITGILDRLEERGLVERIPSQDDRRSIQIQLTERGVELCTQLFPKLVNHDTEIFGKALTPEQTRQFIKLLTLLVRRMEADAMETTRTDASAPNNGRE